MAYSEDKSTEPIPYTPPATTASLITPNVELVTQPCQSEHIKMPTATTFQSKESTAREAEAKAQKNDWVMNNDPKKKNFFAVDMDGFLSSLDDHIAFMATTPGLPRNYKEAMLQPEIWKPAMDTEMKMMSD
ncbi:hypothetical protein M422DRAFT_258074 [Sphaerobolus stellatus SS14]|uniref:Uncharacterized protein n=1 Tax=Sphaerobolus stellatus (strain SS14) TaxID=990650 RepID=A0A0C9UWD3_SPHS4|nr:hypothetical protein M422DRAFT_258074 [Sphaerobolus stellatus SS14]